MKPTIVDNRHYPSTTFGSLKFGEYFEDIDGDICIKTAASGCLCHHCGEWRVMRGIADETKIIPLKATITIER